MKVYIGTFSEALVAANETTAAMELETKAMAHRIALHVLHIGWRLFLFLGEVKAMIYHSGGPN